MQSLLQHIKSIQSLSAASEKALSEVCKEVMFLKNKEVLEYFDYELSGSFENAEFIDRNGLFVGNHHVNISEELSYLYDSILQLVKINKLS